MNQIWDSFPGCECLKYILINCGYDNIASLKLIDNENIRDLEEYVKKNRSSLTLENLECAHKNRYLETRKFEFLIGHKALLIDWCKNYLNDPDNLAPKDVFIGNHSSFSVILRELVYSAVSNEHKNATNHRYSDKLMDFCIYLFIMSGKACYEFMSANLPIPKAGTICKFKLFCFIDHNIKIDFCLSR